MLAAQECCLAIDGKLPSMCGEITKTTYFIVAFQFSPYLLKFWMKLVPLPQRIVSVYKTKTRLSFVFLTSFCATIYP